MGKVIKLTKIFLKSSFSNMDSRMGVSSKSKGKILLYGILFLYFAGLIIFLSYNLLDGLIAIHQEVIFVSLVLFMVFGLAIFQTLFSSINVLYFTKDNEYILPLPFKPYQIILARTLVMLVAEYAIILLIGLIPLVMYGIMTVQGILFYVFAICSLVLLPILPMLLISIIVMIIMGFAKITKNRNRFQLTTYILLIAFVIILLGVTSGIKDNLTNEEMAQAIVSSNGMIDIMKGYVPTARYMTEALTTNSLFTALFDVLKTTIITVIGLVLYLVISQKLYFKGLIGNLFGGGTLKSNKKIKQKRYQNSKLYKSYIGKEFKVLVRNPVFLIQCLLPAILIPILMFCSIYFSLNGDVDMEGSLMKMFGNTDVNSFFTSGIILGVIQFFMMFVYISVTAISREGKSAIVMKYIPVSLYRQYIYKIIPNIIMNIIMIIISLGVMQYILHLPILTLVILFVVASIMGILQSILMIIVDLKRPKLIWDSEYAVAKQNMNLFFPVLLAMINIVVIPLLVYLFKDINVYLGLIILCFLFMVATFMANKYLYVKQNELADKIS